MVALAKPQMLIEMPEIEAQDKNNEWYTPARYVDAARRVMGGIDLDPASCELANMTVKAARYYTEQEDGLTRPWYGKVWLNPPYSKTENRSGIEAFVLRLVNDYDAGNIEQAILLATVRTEAAWYQPLWRYMICFPDHIVHFYKPGDSLLPEKDSRHGHFFGTSFTYLGPNEAAFISEFSRFGTIAKRVSTPRQKPASLSLWEVSE